MATNDKVSLSHISLRQLQKRAEDFIGEHNPGATLPIPIEEIVDLKLGIDIIPVPNLKRVHGIDSYIGHKLNKIVIDEHCYNNFENRTRFSIAHEASHAILHREFYEAHAIETPEGILGFQPSLTDQESKFIENQAYTFAAHILMPPNQFKSCLLDLLDGNEPDKLTVTEAAMLLEKISDVFQVSTMAVLKHTKYNCLEIYQIIENNTRL